MPGLYGPERESVGLLYRAGVAAEAELSKRPPRSRNMQGWIVNVVRLVARRMLKEG